MKRLVLTNDADPARNTLTAGLVTEESRDSQKDLLEVNAVVKQHDDAGAERRTHRAGSLECKRHVEFRGRNENARRPAQQHGLETPVASHTARKLDHLAQSGTERYLVHARANHMATKAKEPVSGGTR